MRHRNLAKCPVAVWLVLCLSLSGLAVGQKGPPFMGAVYDNGNGQARVSWANYYAQPSQFLGIAWDIYLNRWAVNPFSGSMWYTYQSNLNQIMPLGRSGAYHIWVGNHYWDNTMYFTTNPWTGIIFSGTPHQPIFVTTADRGSGTVRLQWKPDYYGVWLYWTIVYSLDTNQFIATQGPIGVSVWHYVVNGSPSFNAGLEDFQMPSTGNYVFYIAAMGWVGQTWSEFTLQSATVAF